MAIRVNIRNSKNPASRGAGKSRLEEKGIKGFDYIEKIQSNKSTDDVYAIVDSKTGKILTTKQLYDASNLRSLSKLMSAKEAREEAEAKKETREEQQFSEGFLKEWNDE